MLNAYYLIIIFLIFIYIYTYHILGFILFGVLNDQFEVLTCISRFSGTPSFNKLLKITFTMVKFILSGTSSHFNFSVSSHAAYLFSTKLAHAYCSFNKRFIWYCGKSINKLLQ